jgi:transposase
MAHPRQADAVCPACQHRSRRVHSHYPRSPVDLPISNWRVRLRLTVKRYRCRVSTCPKAMFTESLDPFVKYLSQRWQAGDRNASELWRAIQPLGYSGTRRQVAQWVYTRREQPRPTTPRRYLNTRGESMAQRPAVSPVADHAPLPAARQLVWLFLKHTLQLEPDEVMLRDRLLRHPTAAKAKGLVQDFQRMVRERRPTSWTAWLKACDQARIPELVNFAAGLCQDGSAAHAALESKWSNGQTEGQGQPVEIAETPYVWACEIRSATPAVSCGLLIFSPEHESCGRAKHSGMGKDLSIEAVQDYQITKHVLFKH